MPNSRNLDDIRTLSDFVYSTQITNYDEDSLDDSDWALNGLEESFLDDIDALDIEEDSLEDSTDE